MENLVEREEGHVVQPEDCGRGQGGGVDDIDGEQEEGDAKEREQVMRLQNFLVKMILAKPEQRPGHKVA